MNISEHSTRFIHEMKRRGFTDDTVKNYASCIRHFFAWSTKDHPKNINEEDIKNYLGTFTEPNTQRAHHSAIKKFYDICLGQTDKFKFIPYCRKSRKLPIVLSQDEMVRLFAVCTNLKHKSIMALMYGCGLRISEVLNLKPENIDSSRMIINVLQAKGKKDRQVMLPDKLLLLLRKYYAAYKPKQYLFNGQDNAPQYSERSINLFVKAYATKAKINSKRIYAHLFRHTSFTHMMENGTDINLIQKLAGHSSVKTTMLYCHTSHKLISSIASPLTAVI